MKNIRIIATFGAFALVGGLAACGNNNGPTLLPGPGATAAPVTGSTAQPTGKFVQIELLSRPAVKEVFEPFVDHQKTNAVEPYADTTIQTDIKATEDALRPPNTGAGTDYGSALAGILYPNVYKVDISQPAGGYLGIETGNAAAAFGGRNINDNVVDTSLGALFGNTLSKLGVIADDGEENNCLSQQNLSLMPSQKSLSFFPYLNSPH
jgi:hypothetical protein